MPHKLRTNLGTPGKRISANVMKETINSAPRMMLTYRGANTGCHLKMKLATSVSTTSLAVAFGGEVRTALLIDEAYVGFGFFGRSRIDVAQQPVEIERACPNEVRWLLNRL
jgi:hypothetical protein